MRTFSSYVGTSVFNNPEGTSSNPTYVQGSPDGNYAHLQCNDNNLGYVPPNYSNISLTNWSFGSNLIGYTITNIAVAISGYALFYTNGSPSSCAPYFQMTSLIGSANTTLLSGYYAFPTSSGSIVNISFGYTLAITSANSANFLNNLNIQIGNIAMSSTATPHKYGRTTTTYYTTSHGVVGHFIKTGHGNYVTFKGGPGITSRNTNQIHKHTSQYITTRTTTTPGPNLEFDLYADAVQITITANGPTLSGLQMGMAF